MRHGQLLRSIWTILRLPSIAMDRFPLKIEFQAKHSRDPKHVKPLNSTNKIIIYHSFVILFFSGKQKQNRKKKRCEGFSMKSWTSPDPSWVNSSWIYVNRMCFDYSNNSVEKLIRTISEPQWMKHNLIQNFVEVFFVSRKFFVSNNNNCWMTLIELISRGDYVLLSYWDFSLSTFCYDNFEQFIIIGLGFIWSNNKSLSTWMASIRIEWKLPTQWHPRSLSSVHLSLFLLLPIRFTRTLLLSVDNNNCQ